MKKNNIVTGLVFGFSLIVSLFAHSAHADVDNCILKIIHGSSELVTSFDVKEYGADDNLRFYKTIQSGQDSYVLDFLYQIPYPFNVKKDSRDMSIAVSRVENGMKTRQFLAVLPFPGGGSFYVHNAKGEAVFLVSCRTTVAH